MPNPKLTQLFDLLDTLPNPVTLNELAYDDDGNPYDKIIYVNRMFKKHIGYTTEDIPNDRVWFTKAYPDPEYQTYIMNEWFNAVEQAAKEQRDLSGFPAKVHCKDGAERWFQITTQLDHSINGEYRTIVFVQTDPPEETKLKLDETSIQLMKKKRMLQTIIDHIPIRIFWKDAQGRYLGCNRSFLQDAQLEHESEIIGKTDYEMIWKEDAERFRHDDAKVRESGIPKLNFIERQPRENMEPIILSTSKVPLIGGNGETMGIIGIYQDITEQVQSAQKIKEQEEMMIVQSRQAAMGEMISMIAHQWRQPLSTIASIVGTYQIKNSMGVTEFPKMDIDTEAIMDQITYLSDTITDFRDFFRPHRKKEHITIADSIHNTLKIVNKAIEDNAINLVIDNRSSSYIETYSKELQQVLINLIKNSIDALVERRESNRFVKIESIEQGNELKLKIIDNGGGIAKEIQPRIFEPYYSTKEEKNGTGLGLYMSKTIIERHLDGSIYYEQTDDGSCFTLSLPLR